MYIEMLFINAIFLVVGVSIGLLMRGVNISVNHNQKPQSAPGEPQYNETFSNLPKEYEDYLNETEGQIKF